MSAELLERFLAYPADSYPIGPELGRGESLGRARDGRMLSQHW